VDSLDLQRTSDELSAAFYIKEVSAREQELLLE